MLGGGQSLSPPPSSARSSPPNAIDLLLASPLSGPHSPPSGGAASTPLSMRVHRSGSIDIDAAALRGALGFGGHSASFDATQDVSADASSHSASLASSRAASFDLGPRHPASHVASHGGRLVLPLPLPQSLPTSSGAQLLSRGSPGGTDMELRELSLVRQEAAIETASRLRGELDSRRAEMRAEVDGEVARSTQARRVAEEEARSWQRCVNVVEAQVREAKGEITMESFICAPPVHVGISHHRHPSSPPPSSSPPPRGQRRDNHKVLPLCSSSACMNLSPSLSFFSSSSSFFFSLRVAGGAAAT